MSEESMDSFLYKAGWGAARRLPFMADWSTRKFYRLRKEGDATSILMRSDPSQKTREFVQVAEILGAAGVSAPTILDSDIERGFVLMEDFGDQNYGRLMDEANPRCDPYVDGIRVLAHLHQQEMKKPDGLPVFDAALFTQQVGLFVDYYFPMVKNREASDTERATFSEAWGGALSYAIDGKKSLLLRDYMPDNLMLLKGREGVRQTGLLDFQDAGWGPIPYDVASLCECVRRNVGRSVLHDGVRAYLKINPIMDEASFLAKAQILSAQRHMRILGILAKNPAKHNFLSRVLAYVYTLFEAEPRLLPVRTWVQRL